jgi:hypothetical protein
LSLKKKERGDGGKGKEEVKMEEKKEEERTPIQPTVS